MNISVNITAIARNRRFLWFCLKINALCDQTLQGDVWERRRRNQEFQKAVYYDIVNTVKKDSVMFARGEMRYIHTLHVPAWDTYEEAILEKAGVKPEQLEGLELSRKRFEKLYKETKLILQLVVTDGEHAQVLDFKGAYPASSYGVLPGMDPTGYFANHSWPRKRGFLLRVPMEVPSVWNCVSFWEAGKTLSIPETDPEEFR